VAVASAHSNEIYIIDIKTMTLTKTIILPTCIYGLQYVEGEFVVATYSRLTWFSTAGLELRDYKLIQMLGLFVLSVKTIIYVQMVTMLFPTQTMRENNLHILVRC
jgi:hypothetical protein